jgi:acetolactate synthase-1/2/3 large subunit
VLDGKPADITAAVELMLQASRPVIYAGGGILKARGADELRALAEKLNIPVVTTLMARGALPDSHELNLGMPGMHGNYTAIMAMQESDLLIALGSRFDDRVTGRLDGFAPDAKVIHVDIDPAELGKIRTPDVAIRGDAKRVMAAMLDEIGSSTATDHTTWRSTLSGWQENYPLAYEPAEPGAKLKPQMVLERLHALSPEDTIVASGVGQHQMWASQYWKFEHPYTWLNSGGLGTMGYSIPAAIGAKVGMPDRTVWSVDGDGCFQMTCQELITASVEKIPIKVALLNNSFLGMVRQWQEMFYDNRYSEVDLGGPEPDNIMMSEAKGCVAIRVEDPDEVDAAIERANSINDRPVVIEFVTESEENVYPMVPGGKTNSDVVVPPFQEKETSR